MRPGRAVGQKVRGAAAEVPGGGQESQKRLGERLSSQIQQLEGQNQAAAERADDQRPGARARENHQTIRGGQAAAEALLRKNNQGKRGKKRAESKGEGRNRKAAPVARK